MAQRLIDATTLRAEFTGGLHELWHYTGIWAMIDVAPTIEPKQEWISVKDRLPEEGEQVLVYWDDGFEIGRYVGGAVGDGVYWMPLPEPPEKNNEEEQA